MKPLLLQSAFEVVSCYELDDHENQGLSKCNGNAWGCGCYFSLGLCCAVAVVSISGPLLLTAGNTHTTRPSWQSWQSKYRKPFLSSPGPDDCGIRV